MNKLKLIYYLIRYDFEMVKPYREKTHKGGRYVNVYEYDDVTLLKQFHSYKEFYIDDIFREKSNIPLFTENSFGKEYLLYCISLLPRWVSIENRIKIDIDYFPKIKFIDKKNLIYTEEKIKTIQGYNAVYTREKIKTIVDSSLHDLDRMLHVKNYKLLFLKKKDMCITHDGKLKIIGGVLLTNDQYKMYHDMVKLHYNFILYDNLSNIYKSI